MSPDAQPKATVVNPPPDASDTDGGKAKRTNSGKPRGRPIALEKELSELFTQIGMGVMMANQFDGLVVINQAEDNAKALAKLANKNARVKALLESIVNVSSMGAIAGVLGATAMPILMNHGLIPPMIPMPDDWLEPPVRIAFKEELAQQREEMKANGNGNGS